MSLELYGRQTIRRRMSANGVVKQLNVAKHICILLGSVVRLYGSYLNGNRRLRTIYKTLVDSLQAYSDVQFIWLYQQEAAATVAHFASLHGILAVQTWLDVQGFMPQHTGQNDLHTTLFYDAAGQLHAVRNGELSAAILHALVRM